MTYLRIHSVAVVGLILAGLGLRVWGLADHRARTLEIRDPIVDVVQQLRRDLERATFVATRDADALSAGYLEYIEGPRVDTTGAPRNVNDERLANFSANASGDTDDLLALTASADQSAPFTGIVPWGVIEAARALSLGSAHVLPSDFDPAAPRSIESDVAELVHGMSPAHEAGRHTSPPSQLHRRVFLIRPDLNVTSERLAAAGKIHDGFSELAPDQPVLGYLRADGVVQPYGAPSHDSRVSMELSVAPVARSNGVADPASASPRFLTANSLAALADPARRVTRWVSKEGTSTESRFLAGEPRHPGATPTEVLGFDVQVFDPEAPIFIGVGADGEPGRAGFDDNGNGIVDHDPDNPMKKDRGEFGAVGSDDPIVAPSDASFFDLVRGDPSASASISRGVFVDHGYAICASGNVRLGIEEPNVPPVRQEYFPLLLSRYSGVESLGGTTARPRLTARPDPGRLNIDGAGGMNERVTLRIAVRYRSTAAGQVHQVEAIQSYSAP